MPNRPRAKAHRGPTPRDTRRRWPRSPGPHLEPRDLATRAQVEEPAAARRPMGGAAVRRHKNTKAAAIGPRGVVIPVAPGSARGL